MNETLVTAEDVKDKIRRFARQYGIPLDEVGFTQPAEPVRYQCDACQDKGSVSYDVPIEHALFGKLQDCPNPDCPMMQARRRERYAKLVAASHLPPEYAALSFADWQTLVKQDAKTRVMAGKWDAWTAARMFVKARASGYWFTLQEAAADVKIDAPPDAPVDRKNSLVIQGPGGVGKTSLAACIANALLNADAPEAVVYIRAATILDAMWERQKQQDKAEYEHEYGNTVQAIQATFERVPVLVIDEMNLQKYSDFTRQVMENIMRARMAARLPTVITCNVDFDTFRDESDGWGWRCGDAVQHMAHWICMGGVELRRRNRPVESR